MDQQTFAARFSADETCLAELERRWWPDGPRCPGCGSVGQAGRITTRAGHYSCRACGQQFTVTRGTALHGTHLPLPVWFRAMGLYAESGQTISARAIGQELNLPYSTAWTLRGRIRAMAADGTFPFPELVRPGPMKKGQKAAKLVPDMPLSYGDAPFRNLIIEGEALDALTCLRQPFQGLIDLVLIDPPYNTGSNFTYQDRFDPDEWRSGLKARLLAARPLLSETGAMMVCINDAGRATAEAVLAEVMSEQRVGSIVWRSRTGSATSATGLSEDHEHVLVYANPGFRFTGTERRYVHYGNPDQDERGDWHADNLSKAHTYMERPNGYFPILDPATGIAYPCNPDAVWRFVSRHHGGTARSGWYMEDLIADGRVIFPAEQRVETWPNMDALQAAIDRGDVPRSRGGGLLLRRGLPGLEFWVGKPVGFGRPRLKRFRGEHGSTMRPLSSWASSTFDRDQDHGGIVCGGTAEGTRDVQRLLGGKSFSYPKPLSLIEGLAAQATTPDSIVLDFFGGSGTTAHAVMSCNRHHGGTRRFILVSAPESRADQPGRNQTRDVTAARVRSVIEAEGWPEDFLYARVTRGRGRGDACWPLLGK